MVYCYRESITEPGFECEKAVFVLGTLDVDGEQKTIDTVELMRNSQYFEVFEQQGVPLKIAKLPTIDMPVAVIGVADLDSVDQAVIVTPIKNLAYGQFEEFGGIEIGDERLSSLKNVINGAISNEALTVSILSGIMTQYVWEHAEETETAIPADINLLDDDFSVVTKNYVDSLNAKFSSALGNLPGINNVTVYQHACEDPLFIALPTLQQLSDEDLKYSEIIPARRELCDPYTNQVLYTYRYKDIVAPGSFEQRLVEGSSDNNKTELYPNEVKFHDALDTWIKYNINENPRLQGGTVIDAVSQSFLRELISYLYMYHWGHLENMPVSINDSYDEESESFDSRYMFADIEGRGRIGSNAILSLLSFVSDASAAIGYTVYVDTIIQLCRWGTRKPTRILIDGYDQFFNLGKGVAEAICVVRGEAKLQKINGCDYSLICGIKDQTPIADRSVAIDGNPLRRWPMSVGVLLKAQYVDDAGNVFPVNKAFSMIDLIREMLLNGMTVDGITVSNGSFTAEQITECVTTDEMITLNERDDQLQKTIFRSMPLENLYMRLATGAIDSLTYDNQFTIMRSRMQLSDAVKSFDRYRFSSYAELKNVIERTCSTTGTVINACVAAVLYKVYFSVAAKYQQTWGLTECINAWRDAMIETNYVDEAVFYKEMHLSGDAIPGVAKDGMVQDTRGVTTMNSFESRVSGQDAGQVSGRDVVQPQTANGNATGTVGVSVYMQIPDECEYYRIKAKDNAVGVCVHIPFTVTVRGGGVKRFSRFIVLNKETASAISDEVIGQHEVQLETIVAHAINLLMKVGGSNSPQQLYFEDAQAIKELRSICNSMYSLLGVC